MLNAVALCLIIDTGVSIKLLEQRHSQGTFQKQTKTVERVDFCNSLIAPDITAAILVERTIAKKSWKFDSI